MTREEEGGRLYWLLCGNKFKETFRRIQKQNFYSTKKLQKAWSLVLRNELAAKASEDEKCGCSRIGGESANEKWW